MTLHTTLAQGKWYTLSLVEQLANIGSEVQRAMRSRGDVQRFDNAVMRAFELFEFTLNDERWRYRRKEIVRAKELFSDAVLGGKEYGTTLEDLDRYFYYFAFAARNNK